MYRGLRQESIAESRSRKFLSEVPVHHNMIDGGTFRGRTMSGLDFELRVVENTTNGQAKTLLEQRINEAKKARLEGKPVGQHMSNQRIMPVAKGAVYLTTNVGPESYRIEIKMEGERSYKVEGKYHPDLKSAVESEMRKAEMKLNAINAAANASSPYVRTMR